MDEIVFNHVENIFSGNIVEEKFLFRVTRNAELDDLLDDDHMSISEALADGLREKKFSPVVRLEVSDHPSSWCLNKILEELKLSLVVCIQSSRLLTTRGLKVSLTNMIDQVFLPKMETVNTFSI